MEVEVKGRKSYFEVLIRPGVNDMLRQLSELYEICVYTAATQSYMEGCVEIIDPFGIIIDHSFSREDSSKFVKMGDALLKDLSVFLSNRHIENVLLVDNRPQGAILSFENLIPIPDFYGQGDYENLIKELT